MLEFGTVVYGRYKIVSMPYSSKELAYKDIREFWNGVDCTTYYDNSSDKWYIIAL